MNYSSRQQPSKHWFRKVDWILVLVITVLAIISVTLISSAMGVYNIVRTSVLDKLFITSSELLWHFSL